MFKHYRLKPKEENNRMRVIRETLIEEITSVMEKIPDMEVIEIRVDSIGSAKFTRNLQTKTKQEE